MGSETPADGRPTATDKRCPKCLTIKPITEFNRDSGKADGLDSRCRFCRADPAAVRANTISKYGITMYEWHSAFAMQNQRCALCRGTESRHRFGWFTDHNHVTGQVRGILCYQCNTVVGYVEGGWCVEVQQVTEYLNDPPFPRHMAMVYGDDDQQLVDHLT